LCIRHGGYIRIHLESVDCCIWSTPIYPCSNIDQGGRKSWKPLEPGGLSYESERIGNVPGITSFIIKGGRMEGALVLPQLFRYVMWLATIQQHLQHARITRLVFVNKMNPRLVIGIRLKRNGQNCCSTKNRDLKKNLFHQSQEQKGETCSHDTSFS
jgi:hypothetical protein